jgi:hypothetical protein
MELYKGRMGENVQYAIKNSETISERAFGEMVSGSGIEEADAVNDTCLFLVEGFRDAKGAPLGSGFTTSTTVDGTFTQSNTGNTYAAAADNMTVAKVVAEGRKVEHDDVYTAELSATVGKLCAAY